MAEHVSLMQLNYDKWLEIVRARLLQHVQQNLLQYYPELVAQPALKVTLARSPRRKRYTVIFELAVVRENGTPAKKLIAKAYRMRPGHKNDEQEKAKKCEQEFLIHKRIHEYFQTLEREFTVVRPIDYLPELVCIIIEKASGRDLGTLVHETRHTILHFDHSRNRLRTHFQRAGKWLQLFHAGFVGDITVAPQPPSFEEQLRRCFERLASSGVAPHHLDALQPRLQTLTTTFAGSSLPQTLLHGDLKPCHIFVTKRRVIPIDFGNVMLGAGYDEVARMLAEIQLIDFGLTAPIHQRLVDDLQRQFILGYFGHEQWQPLLRFYYINWLCAKWLRRLHKHKWMAHPVARRTQVLIRKLEVKEFINRTYVTPWFYTFLMNAINILEKEIR
ncbi:MAG: phosphotransferase [bacterium]